MDGEIVIDGVGAGSCSLVCAREMGDKSQVESQLKRTIRLRNIRNSHRKKEILDMKIGN